MRIRVAIVEDDPLFLRQATTFVELFGEQTGRDFSVTTFNSATTFLKEFNANFDILLLDILMPSYNGIEVAQEVRKSDENLAILFITSTPQYAIKGYTVNALSYILKPLSWPAFEAEFSRGRSRARRGTPHHHVAIRRQILPSAPPHHQLHRIAAA